MFQRSSSIPATCIPSIHSSARFGPKTAAMWYQTRGFMNSHSPSRPLGSGPSAQYVGNLRVQKSVFSKRSRPSITQICCSLKLISCVSFLSIRSNKTLMPFGCCLGYTNQLHLPARLTSARPKTSDAFPIPNMDPGDGRGSSILTRNMVVISLRGLYSAQTLSRRGLPSAPVGACGSPFSFHVYHSPRPGTDSCTVFMGAVPSLMSTRASHW
mmetsp:Transcript_53807/g.131527  ORF Transcript_53807/g.131527 Transcript_53807/m.131527 type:complete len:212 (-) Transcript_53807:3778-4413(-)